jgi:hypothetical protein
MRCLMRRLLFLLTLFGLLIASTLGAYRIIEVPEAAAKMNLMHLAGGVPVANAGPWTFIAHVKAAASGTGTTLNSDSNFAEILAGDVLVTWATWYAGAGGTLGCTTGGTTNIHTFDSAWYSGVGGGSSVFGAFGYCLVADAGTNVTMTFTNSTTRGYRCFHVLQFRPGSGHGAVSKDVSSYTGTGSSNTQASGLVTTTGTNEIVIGGTGDTVIGTLLTMTVKGGAATYSYTNTGTTGGAWASITTLSNEGVGSTTGDSGEWICGVVSFKY